MDKDAQMISLVFNITKDLFQIVRSGLPGLSDVLDKIHDAAKPYAQKLAEPGVITESSDLDDMRDFRTKIKTARKATVVIEGANDVLTFLVAKNDESDVVELETDGIINSDSTDSTDSANNNSGSSENNSGSSENPDVTDTNNDSPDGENSTDEPDSDNGSSISDS